MELNSKIEELEFKFLRRIEELEMRVTLLENELTTVRNEGCWLYYKRCQELKEKS